MYLLAVCFGDEPALFLSVAGIHSMDLGSLSWEMVVGMKTYIIAMFVANLLWWTRGAMRLEVLRRCEY